MAVDPQHVYRLLSIAAHDIRGPLSGIKGMSELVLSDSANLTGEQKECIALMHRASSDLISMLNDLLDYAIIEQDRLELKPVRLDLRRLVQDRVRIQGTVSARKHITIAFTAEDAAVFVVADRRRIAQALDNLLSNAVKFSPLGGVVQVLMRRLEGDRVQIDVRDSGPGIPAEQMDGLFTAFTPLGTRATGGETCTGLGLVLVKRLVDMHHGELRIGNAEKPASGLVVTMTLPLAGGEPAGG